jgi:putative ABC transport system permease protein
MLQDYKLGLRMLLKFPGLTLAGGLALVIAIGIGAGWYNFTGKMLSPTIPLPDGDRIVEIETHNLLTNETEARVLRDFLEWRRDLRTIEGLGAYRTDTRNLIVGDLAEPREGVPGRRAPELIQMAELTAGAFATARVAPLLGRTLVESDEVPGAPGVLVLAYDVWQRSLGGRPDIVGTVVQIGNTPATVIGVMPEGFGFPYNHHAWTPLSLRASYEPLAGSAINVIGRLAPGVSREQADAELRVFAERTSVAFRATHEHLRPRVWRLGETRDVSGFAELAIRNVPALLVLAIACLSVGTLVYARTATREGEIAVRSALGASRARIVGQLFVETLVLSSSAAAVGLFAADRVLRWFIAGGTFSGNPPFWLTPGLRLSTMLYAGGLAVVSAGMLAVLPAVRATRTRVQLHLANMGGSSATLRFGRVWTGAMIVQIALTVIGIPTAMSLARDVMQSLNIRAAFPGREYLGARVDLDRPFEEESTAAFEQRRTQTFAALQRRVEQEAAVVAVTFADRMPGGITSVRFGEVEPSPGARGRYEASFRLMSLGPGFFETFGRPIVAGRPFNGSDWNPTARTVIVNEGFARRFSRATGIGSPVGARLRYTGERLIDDAALGSMVSGTEFDIVGVVRDFGLDPDSAGEEKPYVFHTASAATVSPLLLIMNVRGNPDPLAARLPVIAADVDARLFVRGAQALDASMRQRDRPTMVVAGGMAAVTSLVLFLSGLGIFSLVSVSVSRRTRDIGLRVALGANPRQVLAGILSHAAVVMGSGVGAGGALLLWFLVLDAWFSGRRVEDIGFVAGSLAATGAIMAAAGVLACIVPARRALRISPTDALREV